MGGQVPFRPGVALLFAAILLTPGALALPGRVGLTTDAPVAVSGAFAAIATHGSFFFHSEEAHGDVILTGATGKLSLATTQRVHSLGSKNTIEESHENVTLANATVILRHAGEVGHVRARPHDGGRIGVAAPVDSIGEPHPLTTGFMYETCTPSTSAKPTVPVCWGPGWWALGVLREAPDLFPRLSRATLWGEGTLDVQLNGGTLLIQQPGEPDREIPLGPRPEGTTPTLLGSGVYVSRSAFFTGTTTLAAPAQGEWAIGAPEMVWNLDGALAWTRATGTATYGGTTVRFDDAAVRVAIQGEIAPAALGLVGGSTYEASGEIEGIVINGAPVSARTPEQAVASAGGVVSVVAALGFLLTKLGQALLAGAAAALYSRLARSDLLHHEMRRRIHEITLAEPGIHQRELFRRVGGAWGPFVFHLRILERGGYLRLVSTGRYVVIYPATIVPPATSAPPAARVVLDRLPVDGSAVPGARLAQELQMSADLLRYHARTLEKLGLARRVRTEPGGVMLLARVTADPAAQA